MQPDVLTPSSSWTILEAKFHHFRTLWGRIQRIRRYLHTIIHSGWKYFIKSHLSTFFKVYFLTSDIWIFCAKKNYETILMIFKHCSLPSIHLMVVRPIISAKWDFVKIGQLIWCNVVTTRSFHGDVSIIPLLGARSMRPFRWRHFTKWKDTKMIIDEFIFTNEQHNTHSIPIILDQKWIQILQERLSNLNTIYHSTFLASTINTQFVNKASLLEEKSFFWSSKQHFCLLWKLYFVHYVSHPIFFSGFLGKLLD